MFVSGDVAWLHNASGDTVFTEGCGLCSSEEMAAKMYDSFQYLKNNLTNNIMICPGHSYSERHIEPFSYHLTSNIYFQFDEPQKFINYRLRKNQKNLFRFVWFGYQSMRFKTENKDRKNVILIFKSKRFLKNIRRNKIFAV